MPGQPHAPFSVLIIGELGGRRAELAAALSAPEFSVISVPDPTHAKGVLRDTPEIAVALIDHALGSQRCYELLAFAQSTVPACQVIVYAQRPGIYDAMEATRRGAFWFLPEPFELEQLLFLVSKACIVHELSAHNQTLRDALSAPASTATILGDSEAIKSVLHRADKIAPLDASILLTGESGTGKTSLAHYIHQRNPRSTGPFIAVSCAAIPRDLLESELFGHEKGSFTGATAHRTGAIELADGGTLFLDEIGDLPLELQPKLLTFLQDRMVKRVGSSKSRHVDVRVITATHRNLIEMCHRREFREDLLFRINVLSIELPPLRAHPEDIPLLVERILSKISAKRGVKPFTVDAGAWRRLKEYHWPGNIRELENVLERATAWAESPVLRDSDFGCLSPAAPTEILTAENAPVSFVGMTLAELEKRAILETLAACHGNKSEAAKLLGVSLKTIYNKLEKLGVSVDGPHTNRGSEKVIDSD